jgi:hypothetical protein
MAKKKKEEVRGEQFSPEDLVNFVPEAIDMALHGRKIENTPYKTLWTKCINILSNYTSLAYTGLMRSDVRFSLFQGPTACISMITQQVFINPTFMRLWIETPSDLAFVIMHELLHPLVDPTFKYPINEATNFASDALINSTIFRISPSLTYWTKKFYSNNSWPGCFLRPGCTKSWKSAINKDKVKRTEVEGMYVAPRASHLEMYQSLYPIPRKAHLVSRPSIDTIIESFYPPSYDYMTQPDDRDGNCKTLRGFSPNGMPSKDFLDGLSEEMRKRVEELVEAMNKEFPDQSEYDLSEQEVQEGEDLRGQDRIDAGNEMAGSGAGKGGDLRDFWIEVAEREAIFERKKNFTKMDRMRQAKRIVDSVFDTYKETAFRPNENDFMSQRMKEIDEFFVDDGVEEAYLLSSMRDVRGQIIEMFEDKPIPENSLIPGTFTRSSAALFAAGYTPQWYKNNQQRSDEEQRSVKLYVDVSGSMYDQLKWVIRLIREMQARSRPDLYVFSTVICPTSIEELIEGKFSSTGGTSFNEVIEHFCNIAPEPRCLIITDGIDHVSAEKKKLLDDSGKEANVLIVENHCPGEGTIRSSMSWANHTFLQKREWWKEIGMVEPRY